MKGQQHAEINWKGKQKNSKKEKDRMWKNKTE